MDYQMEDYLPTMMNYYIAVQQYLYPEADDLPPRPLPNLDETLDKYLDMANNFATGEALERTKNAVESFRNGAGIKAQTHLMRMKEEHLNWFLDYFVKENYLDLRFPLPINLNPAVLAQPRVFENSLAIAEFATAAIIALLELKEHVNNKTVDIEKAPGSGRPLCMAQWYCALTSCRVPGPHRDFYVTTLGEKTLQEHVIIMHKNQMYSVVVKRVEPDGTSTKVLSPEEITHEVLAILENHKRDTQDAVGILTTMERGKWATAYSLLIQDAENQLNVEKIKSSLAIICLDGNIGEMEQKKNKTQHDEQFSGSTWRPKNPVSETVESNMMHQVLHGGGSRSNGANRWYDKVIQLIVCENGTNGICMEHTVIDGICHKDLMQRITKMANSMTHTHNPVPPPVRSTRLLRWNCSVEIKKYIACAKKELDKLIDDLDIHVERFDDFGKSAIKLVNCSPNVMVQLSLQLAQYRMYGKLASSWESISLRRFILGRVDVGRSDSHHTLQWLEAMLSNDSTDATKLKLLDKAIKYHTQKMVECSEGKGADGHLMALRRSATTLIGSIPPMFRDPVHDLVFRYFLGTSQVASEDTITGYGFPVRDSYGCCYNIRNEEIVFSAVSWRSDRLTDTKIFAAGLKEALRDVIHLLADRPNIINA